MRLTHSPGLASVGLLVALAASAGTRPLAAQAPTIHVACVPFAPECTQLEFRIRRTSGFELASLSLSLGQPSPWSFTPVVPDGSSGIHESVDDLGPFGGPTTIEFGGKRLDIDFLESGWPFTMLGSGTGFVRLAADPGIGTLAFRMSDDVRALRAADLSDLSAKFTLTLVGGETYSGAVGVVPEPATVGLLGAGLAGLAGAAWRRRRATLSSGPAPTRPPPAPRAAASPDRHPRAE